MRATAGSVVAGVRTRPSGRPRAEKLLQLPTPLPVRPVAQILAVAGEQVEHDVRRRRRGDEAAHAGAAGAEPVLQRGEVEPAGPPHDELTVEDDVVEPGDRGGDVGEPCGEVAQLAGLQVHAVPVAEGQRPESVVLRLIRPAGPGRELRDGLRRHRRQRRAQRRSHRRTVGTSRRADRQRTQRSQGPT